MIPTPPAFGAPLFQACLKSRPENFVVNEHLDIEFQGSGEHLFMHIEKVGVNTDEIAQLLESSYQVKSADIGLSGLKDRHAVTRQWFSVRTPLPVTVAEEALASFSAATQGSLGAGRQGSDGGDTLGVEKTARMIDSVRHGRKLRRGTHKANEFSIVLSDLMPLAGIVASELVESVHNRLAQIEERGFPNYLGPQRFGVGGQNLVRARQWFRQPRKRTSRTQRSFWLSAARSAVFNQICAARVDADNWCELLDGEPAMLAGTNSFFDTGDSTAETLMERLANFDIHPSAAWWGRGASTATGQCGKFENEALLDLSDLCAGLENAGLAQERRALRAQAHSLEHRWLDDSTLELRFNLSPGVFATTLLDQLGQCEEPDRRLDSQIQDGRD